MIKKVFYFMLIVSAVWASWLFYNRSYHQTKDEKIAEKTRIGDGSSANHQKKWKVDKYGEEAEAGISKTTNDQKNVVVIEESNVQIDQMEAYFENIEQQWVLQIKELFKELELDKSQLEKYFQLREEYEKKRLEQYEQYHEKMIREHGQDFKFHISEVEIQKEVREINISYRDRLREIIGDDNYVQYLELKDRFNEKVRIDEHIDYGAMEISF